MLFFISALCIYNEVHQSASAVAGCPHPQTSASCSHLDGLFAGLLPWTPGQISSFFFALLYVSNVGKSPFMLFVSQVLKGDIRPAIETHEMLYQVTKKHNFLPEVISVYLTWLYFSFVLITCLAWLADPSVLHLSPGLHYWFQGALGSTSPEAWVCRKHLLPL